MFADTLILDFSLEAETRDAPVDVWRKVFDNIASTHQLFALETTRIKCKNIIMQQLFIIWIARKQRQYLMENNVRLHYKEQSVNALREVMVI
jgi:hypothetical protein